MTSRSPGQPGYAPHLGVGDPVPSTGIQGNVASRWAVRTVCVGDETPEVVQQAQRVEQFMNYQVMEVMEEYDPDMDQMLFHLPLSGSTFKKVYFDLARQRAVSKFVPAEDVDCSVLRHIRTAERITHVMKMSDNDIVKMQLATVYRDVDLGSSGMDDDGDLQDKKDQL